MPGVILFLVGVITLAGIYAILAMILNLEAGWAGMWDLGLAGLVAVGGYVFIITTQATHEDVVFAPGWPMWAGVIAGSLASGIAALIIGIPSLRVRGEYFLITTLAFAEVIRQLSINLGTVTRGTVGFNQFSRPFESIVSGSAFRWFFMGMVWVLVLVVYLLMRRLGHSPYGRLLRGFRDNDPVARSLGKHTNRHRIQTFVLAGLMYGAVAPLYVWFIRTVTPSLFTSEVTFVTWTALVIGGIASLRGPIIGAAILLIVTEAAALVQGSGEMAVVLASARFIILGLVLIIVMRFRPEGLAQERDAFAGASRRLQA